ncbi:MAG: transposase [Planctomycetaceae bacterium]|nr:transposase [Planctomycetaceae bacterium]
MASTYTSLAYHIVFSTKHRENTLTDSIRQATWNYISGIITNKNGQLLEIGGVEDHVHLLTSCSPRIALADFVRDIKANSSRWLHDEKDVPNFQWQTGYGAFTVSHSQVDVVRKYLQNQAQHHRRQSFEEEYREFLQRHEIAFDEKYLFEDEFHG